MRKLSIFLFYLIALVASSFTSAKVATSDSIVATVNNNIITVRELDQRLRSVKLNLAHQKITLPKDAVLKAQVLKSMIAEILQVQAAERAGIQVDDAELDKALLQIAQKNKKTLPQFRESLENQGYKFDAFRKQLKDEILINRVREQEIDRRVFVSDAEVSEWLNQQGAHKNQEYALAQILIPVSPNASPEQLNKISKKIEAVQRELDNGANFASVAAKYSSSPDALKGGKIGWRSGATFSPNFRTMLAQLPLGEITEPIRTPQGIHIFKLLDRRTASNQVLTTQTHARHILFRTNEMVSEPEAMRRAEKIIARLKAGASFGELARLESEDASASKGGDLGWLTPGETVPEFQKAMDQLKPGQISSPIRTAFGVHIIEVLERRQHDAGNEQERAQVRMELKQHKAEELYQNWITELYHSAYINIRDKDA